MIKNPNRARKYGRGYLSAKEHSQLISRKHVHVSYTKYTSVQQSSGSIPYGNGVLHVSAHTDPHPGGRV